MDVVGSAAAITQLLGQAITLWQAISRARRAVRAALKTLADTEGLLSGLLETMQLVEREPALQTRDIEPALERIYAVAGELKQILVGMEARQGRSALRQGLHALGHGEADEAHLGAVLARLREAQRDLGVRMGVVSVGLIGGVADKVEQGMQTAAQERRSSTVEKARHHLMLEGNETWDHADQLNGIVALEASPVSTTAKVTGNRALGNGRQKNVIMSEASFLSMFVHLTG